jgi:hypothetical protein
MRSGVNLSLSFAGNISETIIFHTDTGIIGRNLEHVGSWLKQRGSASDGSGISDGYLWKGVSAEEIISFLAEYETHEDATKVKTALLSTYIKRQFRQDELTDWNVLLVSSGSAKTKYQLEGIGELGLIERSHNPNIKRDPKRYVIRRLLNPTDEAKDLTTDGGDQSEYERAKRLTIRNWEQDTRINKSDNEPKRPGGHEIRSVRPKERGLLLIYPLDYVHAAKEHDQFKSQQPMMGIAVSFPGSDTAVEVAYTVNQTFNNAEELDIS